MGARGPGDSRPAAPGNRAGGGLCLPGPARGHRMTRGGRPAAATGRRHPREGVVSYTGNVSVGGPPDSRELPGLSVTKLAVGPMDNNAYLLRCSRTGEALLIDAAAEPGRLIELIGDTPVARIVTTHKHADHWQALAEVQAAT